MKRNKIDLSYVKSTLRTTKSKLIGGISFFFS